MEKTKRVLVALVEDKTGVLNRIASLFRRRRFNIESLTVGRTEKKGISRMTIIADSEKTDIEQVIKQMYKLISVLKVIDATNDNTIFTELALIKINTSRSTRAEATHIIEMFHGKVVDATLTSLIVQLAGDPGKIDSFLELVRSFGIKEMVRTGVTAMGRR